MGARIQIAVLIFLSKACGKGAVFLSRIQSFLGRLQTMILTRAQFMGWRPENAAASDRLIQRQFNLFQYRMTQAAVKAAQKKAKQKI